MATSGFATTLAARVGSVDNSVFGVCETGLEKGQGILPTVSCREVRGSAYAVQRGSGFRLQGRAFLSRMNSLAAFVPLLYKSDA